MSRRHRLAQGLQVVAHRLGIGLRHDQTDGATLLWTDGTKDVGRFRLLLAHHPGARSLARPQARLRAALANAHFILKPDVHLLRRNAWRQRCCDFLEEVFF